MRLISSVLLSLCVILTSGPLMAAYSCNANKLKAMEAISGYKVAEATMNNQVYKHVKAVSSIPQPVQGTLHFAGAAMMTVTHGAEGIGRTALNGIDALWRNAYQAGQCFGYKTKSGHLGKKLMGSVDCVIVAGANTILISTQVANGAVKSVEYAVVKTSDEFFNAAINMSNSAANVLREGGVVGKVLSLPFIVFSAVAKGSKKLIRASVAFVAKGITDFITMAGDVLCNIAAAFSALFNGQFRKFLKILLVGTVGILVNWMKTLITDILNAVKRVFKAIGRALKGNGQSTKPQKGKQ